MRLGADRGLRAQEPGKHPAQVAYLVEEILATCRDDHSRAFYTRVARALPDTVVFQFLAEIRQDLTIENRGAVFATKVKEYLRKHTQNGVHT